MKGINGIAKYLTEQKSQQNEEQTSGTGKSRKWQLLMNRAYIGEFYQNRWNTEGMLGNKYKNLMRKFVCQEDSGRVD
ncbi:hypothetical protein KHA80_04240 [Anaerobacillus sp. HL2]|nr:hypothetical protein KHA80_04240 [Anaerobacillus sp. HL2]